MPACALDTVLNGVARRYRLTAVAGASAAAIDDRPATAIATAIEHAREARARGDAPSDAARATFVDGLARLIREAMSPASPDPVFEAMLLRHRTASIGEYAALSAQAAHDRRAVQGAVNAIAHPAKHNGVEALAQLYALACSGAWSELHDCARQFASSNPGIARLADDAALHRLARLEALARDEHVRRYEALLDQQGARRGSPSALAQGIASKERGAALEARATAALQTLALRLNEIEHAFAQWRVVNSMRVPSSIPGSHKHAKTEWDAVLLRQAKVPSEQNAAWDVRVLVEAKSSADAATTDFPRLLRGLDVLARADGTGHYMFATTQGPVEINGASLRSLKSDDAALSKTVLYCCAAPPETTPRLLSAASRMKLLSADASLQFASALADGNDADLATLETVWQQLLESPQWHAVLEQQRTLRRVRELMVHIDDLQAAVQSC